MNDQLLTALIRSAKSIVVEKITTSERSGNDSTYQVRVNFTQPAAARDLYILLEGVRDA